MDPINLRKNVNFVLKSARNDSKPDKCILCKQSETSFCNSHSVPQMFLKNIAVDGKVLQSSEVMAINKMKNKKMDIKVIDFEKGVKNSGTFQSICNKCDGKVFQAYESPDVWTEEVPTDRVLAQIALKNVLLEIDKKNTANAVYQKIIKELAEKRNTQIGEIEIATGNVLMGANNLDIKEFTEEVELYKEIKTESKELFKILFYEKLPYTVPIATQSAVTPDKDLDNNTFDKSIGKRVPSLHISVFPLKDSTVVIAFYHQRDDEYYQRFYRQFNGLSRDKKLEYINYCIFAYTENFFLSPKIETTIKEDEKLQSLAREVNGIPDFVGHALGLDDLSDERVKPSEITNFLCR